MKQITRNILLVLMLCLFGGTLSAQYLFVVDAMHSDSTALYEYDPQWNNNDHWVKLGEAVKMIPNRTEVKIAVADTIVQYAKFTSKTGDEFEDRIVVATYAGTKYIMPAKDLVLSPNDTNGTGDFINRDENYHTKWGHWYCTSTPYIVILVLIALATIFAALAGREKFLAFLVPVFMLGAIAIEVFGVKILGEDMLWWIDPDQYGTGTLIWRLILFAAVVIMQIFSIRLFKNAIGGDLNVRGPLVGAIVGAILLVISVIAAMIWRKDANMIIYVGVGLLLASIVVGIIIASVKNIREVGVVGGIAFTIFAVIYGVGLVVAVTMLIIGIITALMEMIVTIGGGILVLFVMSKIVPSSSYTRSDGTRVEVYEDFHL